MTELKVSPLLHSTSIPFNQESKYLRIPRIDTIHSILPKHPPNHIPRQTPRQSRAPKNIPRQPTRLTKPITPTKRHRIRQHQHQRNRHLHQPNRTLQPKNRQDR